MSVPSQESTATPGPEPSGVGRPTPPPNRRRDKPQLSCNLCRKRKLRCDRNHPCSRCSKRGLDLQCTYPSTSLSSGTSRAPQRGRPSASTTGIEDRLRHIEQLVVTMMKQGPGATSPQDRLPFNSVTTPRSDTNVSDTIVRAAAITGSEASLSSPAPDVGRLKLSKSESSYVDSSHWTAVLDGITDLKSQVAGRDDAELSDSGDGSSPPPEPKQGPLLLYGCKPATRAELLAAIPPRTTTDRLISHYCNVLDVASAVLHRSEFLKQYNKLWENPSEASPIWLGLVFSMMCLAVQFEHAGTTESAALHVLTPLSPASPPGQLISSYREKIVQSLYLGRYTQGGPFVIETLVHYFAVEHFYSSDSDIGLWLLLGVVVNMAMRMGYHRDPHYFPKLSSYASEMRRRLWASLYHIDIGVSAQMGMPRHINSALTDTQEPRNLLDSDFDEHTVELPPARPETEMTPILYIIAKVRLVSVFDLVTDLVTEIRPCTYEEVMKVDAKLNEAHANIPVCFQWRPLSQSITDPPHAITKRLYLEMIFLKTQITLHRKYLGMSQGEDQYAYSCRTAVDAAMKMLRYQHMIVDEVQPSSPLFPVSWRFSSLINGDFLLATFALCYYVQHKKASIKGTELEEIKGLLRRSEEIWVQAGDVQAEPAKAARVLRAFLDNLDREAQAKEASHTQLSDVDDGTGEGLTVTPDQDPFSMDTPFSSFNTMFDGTSIEPPTLFGNGQSYLMMMPPLYRQSDPWFF